MTAQPPFTHVSRGYSPAEVDEHLARTAAALQGEQARAAGAERRAAELEGHLLALRDELQAERTRVRAIADRVQTAPPAGPGGSAPLRPMDLPPTGAPKQLAPPLLTPPPKVRATREPRTRDRARLLPLGAGLLAGALLGGGAVAAVDRDSSGERAPAAVAPAAPPSTASSPAPSPSRAAARPAALAAPAALPRGWKRVQSGDGTWSIGVPPGWRSVGTGPTRRFVSESGLTTMTVRSGPVTGQLTQAALQQQERALAARTPGYERLAIRVLPYKGQRAGFWDYTLGRGAGSQRASDMGLVVGERGYQLHVQSRASAWRFAAPLVNGFRSSFQPT